MSQAQAVVIVAAELRLFLRPGRRGGPVAVAVDGTSSLGHVVESLGVPLTEVGRLLVNGEPAAPGYRPRNSDVVLVEAVRRPQQLTSARFVLDVHLGALARRLRLAGLDTAYANDAGGGRPDDQLRDVLDRFKPPLAPWTRCPACNGPLSTVAKATVAPRLPPGTRRTYQTFCRCHTCGQVYWHGAHSKRLEQIIDSAVHAASPSENR